MLAGMIETAFQPGGLASLAERKTLCERARQIEKKADRLTVAAREIFSRVRNADDLLQLVDQVENATDCFDEAAFLISLAAEAASADAMSAPLAELAATGRECVGHLVRAIEAALLIPEGKRVDATFALQCVEAVVDAERSADRAERAAIGALIGPAPPDAPPDDARSLVLGLEIAHTLEEATDRLAHAAMALRDRVLQELSA
jgi:uncharacterized protein Yka (UPF0111/DUF47 family)